MARLLSRPLGLKTTSIEFLTGPTAFNAGSTETAGGFVQTSSSGRGLWRMRFSFPPLQGTLSRRYRGWVAALHGGANATRWTFFDPDRMSFQEAGVQVTSAAMAGGVNWSNGQPWSNGQKWQVGLPLVEVAASVAKDATIITLGTAFWGHRLGYGDMIGFVPLHFGAYMVTETIDLGRYRVWPPLRKAVPAGAYATLEPTLALRLESEAAAPVSRGLIAADNLTATFVEVPDEYVPTWFGD